ncbi:integrator complex subunit 5-like [Homarus americanus]|uniref:Integrator complex subunit 5-like n=1 Tax=Homarus americanus TaxID=6706 RepID=A0A8J5N6A4_HOMAM|nr:integrator complex subunit 5-like [Homarus americanus]XP_042212186.1 integrator complex subunit 5-like [Homarus americanus]XP_042212187.1 integrator complex subunit 5-like [Homarus americanus]XP_042212188.1 integrator complex subunit 5-like [Homarus americanus]KAG7174335.1 Integrator complex subunit 5-like [Homarus americanus]
MVVTGAMEAGPAVNMDAGGRGISTTMLLTELDRFLNLALTTSDKRSHGGRRDVISEGEEQTTAETALFLLRNLPPGRPAALAFLAHTLSRQVSSHMRGYTAGDGSRKTENTDEGLSGQIESLLGDLLESTPGVWGPLVSQWAVEQLGRWSVEWANTVVGRGDATLEEVVAGWLSCSPARALASLTVVCVAHDPDTAVAALLDASAASGPALDWLVAHVGCSFPATVISRVLALGLRSFASCHGRPPEHQLASVNKILSHLADRHLPDIRRSLHAILLRTFTGASDAEAQASVPFLLCLAVTSRSRAVLAALTSGLDTLLMPSDRLAALANQVGWWVPRYFTTHCQLQEMVVHLVLDTGGAAAPSLLRLLLQGAAPAPKLPPSVAAAVNNILQGVVGEICMVTYMRKNAGSSRIHIPFLVGLRGGGLDGSDVGMAVGGRAISPVASLVEETLATPGSQASIGHLKQLITLVVVQQGPATATTTLGHLLHCRTQDGKSGHQQILSAVITALMIYQAVQHTPDSPLSTALAGALQPQTGSATIHASLNSLETLLSRSRKERLHIHPTLTEAILINIPLLAELVNDPALGTAAVQVLCQLPLKKPIPVGHVLCLSHAIIFFLFSSLHESSIIKKICNVGMCQCVLSQLAHSSLALNLIIRLLVEGVFRPECSRLFGAQKDARFDSKEVPGEMLIQANRQFNSWVKVPQSHTSIFHMGIIGNGRLLQRHQNISFPSDIIKLHTQLLLNTLRVCCASQANGEGASTVALLLVELISPDIMFNGFPWPEEYIKFTFERDLAIKKTFEEFPIAWSLLEFVATHRAALSYCSVLVRALTAALTAYWNTCPLATAKQAPEALQATRYLLEVMVTAQFLPGPLGVLPQMVNALAPFELVCILQDVWMFMRDNTPSPDRWLELPSGHHQRISDPPITPCYTERIQRIIQSNVATLGHLMSFMVNAE